MSTTIGPVGITVTQEGIYRFVTIILKTWLGVQAALVLSTTTPFIEVSRALRSFGIPELLVSIITFMYRYLFVLIDEVRTMTIARDSRSARPDGKRTGGSVLWRATVTGRMAGSLFIRSYERSERIYMAMLARGFDGQIRSSKRVRLKRPDILFAVLSFIIIAGVVLSYVVL